MKNSKFIRNSIIWNQLISICEEQANVLLKVAFGALVREAGDISAGIFNNKGKMLAQAVTGTPGHVNTMAEAVPKFLKKIASENLRKGDALITNDPWIGAGHIFDFVVVSPIFFRNKIIGYFASTCHVIDVGGIGWSAEGKSFFEEGTLIPVSFLRKKKSINESLLRIITANSRVPNEARGDILSLMSCNDAGINRLIDLLKENSLTNLSETSKFIFDQSRISMKKIISKLKKGKYKNKTQLDGYDTPINLEAKLEITDKSILINLEKSSKATSRGINCPINYSVAYASYGVKAAIAPEIPNNSATLSFIKVRAPLGLIVSAIKPSPVTARHVVGQALPDLVLGCLHHIIPDKIPAESSGALWTISLRHDGDHPFNSLNVALGGMGAKPYGDGLSTTAFPSGVGSIPVEIVENEAPILYEIKEFMKNSGGIGKYRGGLGQKIVIKCIQNKEMKISAAAFEKIRKGPSGLKGGYSGSPGQVKISDGTKIKDKGTYIIPKGKKVIIITPGGGGYGNPKERDQNQIKNDIKFGLVTK